MRLFYMRVFGFSNIRIVNNHELIHPYIAENLQRNNVVQLRDIQVLEAINNKQSCFLNSCTGSGKTLAYLIPVLTQILKQKQTNTNSHQTKSTHGSIILTLNKELALQIYRWIRLLDPQNRIRAKRAGPISHYIPVITELNKKVHTLEQEDEIDRKIQQNLVNTVKWSTTDILVSTPQLLSNIISMSTSAKQPINPATFVIDQADLLLQIDQNISKHTQKILNHISKYENQRQYIISASSFPEKVKKIQHKEALSKKFTNLVFIQGEQLHQIPSNIQLFSVQIDKLDHKDKFYYLKDIMLERKEQRVIIFCNNKKSVEQISAFLMNSLEIPCLEYHASLDSNSRSRVLHRFEEGPQKVIISTDLGSRGLDFSKPINLIIEFQMAQNITVFINRVGRTGRNKIPGEVITFVQQKNRELFDHITQVIENNNKMDQLFSRKRSYRKLYKKK